MRVLKFYIINKNTLKILPFIAENGELYTFVIEREQAIIIPKSPSKLIQDSKQFYLQRAANQDYTDQWESTVNRGGRTIVTHFKMDIYRKNE